MEMRLKYTFLVFSMLLSVSASFAQNYTEAQVRQRINAAASKMNTMQCDFVQTKTLKMLKSKMVSRGRMLYSKPTKLRWEYISPYKYIFLLNGQTVWMKNTQGSNEIDAAQSRMFKEITRIMMSSVLGTCVSNSRDFTVSLNGQGNSWKAILIPKKNPMKQMFKTITVYFDMRKSEVNGVKMIDRNGDATSIVLRNVEVNIPVNAKDFSLH